MIVWARWTVNNGLDSLVVDHLVSDAGVPFDSRSRHLFSFVFLHMFIPPIPTTFAMYVVQISISKLSSDIALKKYFTAL